MRPPPSVLTTRRPMVQAPTKKKIAMSVPAKSFERTPAPTAGPNAGPVVDPPILNPTNSVITSPTAIKTSTIAMADDFPSYRRLARSWLLLATSVVVPFAFLRDFTDFVFYLVRARTSVDTFVEFLQPIDDGIDLL